MSSKHTNAVSEPSAKRARTDSSASMAGNGASAMDSEGFQLDENLHSRQLAVYGREAMARMASAKVLISGANGLGVEIGEQRSTHQSWSILSDLLASSGPPACS